MTKAQLEEAWERMFSDPQYRKKLEALDEFQSGKITPLDPERM